MRRPLASGFWLLASGCFLLAQDLPQGGLVFKTGTRLVEVYATVTDANGHYLDGLSREHFQVLDNGRAQEVVAFERETQDLSCAILMDTTGSMTRALPAVKSALGRLIDSLREGDSVAVYGFTNTLTQLQDFTRDKTAAKKSFMRTRAMGATALFDAIAEVAGDLSRRSGKKALLVFTDGDDNASFLNMDAAAARVRKLGVPLYVVAQGQALEERRLFSELKSLASATGGMAQAAPKPEDAARAFEAFSRGLKHTYLLAYKPPAAHDRKWRSIEVAVAAPKARVRAKEGYFPE